ncbi:CGNR zinc finger domain-containing protein [Nonomuraea fuscirosea]
MRFEDRSQEGRRRWCSMTRCSNRTKAQRHHLRTRTP